MRNAHPDHHAIVKGMFWVGLFVFVGAIARASKEIAIAYRYGTSEVVDAYLFVFNIVNWPVVVWLSLLTVVLLPLTATAKTADNHDTPTFRAEFFGLTLWIGIALFIIFWISLPEILQPHWSGLPPGTAIIALNALPGIAPIAAIGFLTSLFSIWLLMRGGHANTLLESIPPLTLTIFVVLAPASSIAPLLWGTLAGFAFHLVSASILLAHQGAIGAPKFTQKSTYWPSFWQGFGIMAIGQILMSATGLADQFFAAQLGPGNIATLSYANRVLTLFLGLGGTIVSRAMLPVFSSAVHNPGEHAYEMAKKWAGALLFVGGVITLAAWLLSPWAVAILFERGAFTATDSEHVSTILQYGLLQIPFYIPGLVFVALLTSQKRYRALTIICTINLGTKLILNFLLAPVYGAKGLMLASSGMIAMSAIMSAVAVFRAGEK